MKAAIVSFPGTNRERDVAIAIERASGRRPAMLWHREAELPAGLDLVVLPGGFSFGDYLRAGAMAAQSPVMAAVRRFAEGGGYVLGVCNGFQMLCEAGLLPGALLRNASLRFLAMDARLRVERADTAFTQHFERGQVFSATMAHGDGNFFASEAELDRLEGEGLVALRYEGENLNGSARGIAGVLSPNARVLGLMPHPENCVDPLVGGVGGLPMFTSMAEAFASPHENAAHFRGGPG